MAVSLEYLAGILDGEGCIRIFNAKLGKNQNSYAYVAGRVQVAMYCGELIQALQQAFGGTAKAYPRADKRKPVWLWYLNEQDAARLLVKVLPFLIEKKEQAKLLIDLAQRKDRAHRGRITLEEHLYRQELVKKCRELKYA